MLSLSIGPFALALERVLLLTSLLMALVAGWLFGRRHRINVEPIIVQMLLWGVVGARISFVLLYLDDYLTKPLSIIDIRDGGFQIEAGWLVAAGIGVYHARRNQAVRRPLAAAIIAGAFTWAVIAGGVHLTNVRQPALPEFTFISVAGNAQTLTHFAGRPMVVNLWATWCPPCRREMPVLAAAQRQKVDVAFIFVNQGQSAEAVQSYLESEQLQLNNVLLDPDSQLSHRLGIQGMPTTLFFDASGNLVETHMGELSRATLRRGLEQF